MPNGFVVLLDPTTHEARMVIILECSKQLEMSEEISITSCSDDWSYFWYDLSISKNLKHSGNKIDYKLLMSDFGGITQGFGGYPSKNYSSE